MANINLILGGARSGKSRIAEQRVLDSGKPAIYVATATAGDTEMARRIEKHQQDRMNKQWQLFEEPCSLGALLADITSKQSDTAILIDCLTLWLSNCLHQENWQQEKAAFLDFLQNTKTSSNIVLVSNETGLGIVPMGELSRQFVDESGFLHQEIAAFADRVTLVVAGLSTELK